MSHVDVSPAHLTTCWARLLMHSLSGAGVEHFVISPGSRSTPFTWAALQLTNSAHPSAAASPVPQCHIVLDERSAGFIALGMARRTGRPALVLCTSGSAAANYFPAIVEARAAGIPLLVLTADRPLELQHAGAAQTLDQIKLYGDQSIGFFELGAPDPSPLALRSLRRMARQAFALSVGPTAGPVQLNVRAKKPLEPEPDGPLCATIDGLLAAQTSAAQTSVEDVDGDTAAGHVVCRTEALVSPAAAQTLAERMLSAQRGVILCGPLAPWQTARSTTLRRVLDLSGFSLWHEATSNVAEASPQTGSVGRFDTWLRAPAARELLWPDFALQLGPLPTSGSLLRALEHQSLERQVWCPFGHQDPTSNAELVLTVDLEGSLRRLAHQLEARKRNAPVTSVWQKRYERRLAYQARLRQVEAACSQAATLISSAAADELSEASAISALLEQLPATCLLSVGNSLAVRELDWFRTGAPPPRVLSQRGLNGIDGIVSGALGAALTHPGPSAVLLGDLSLLHDVGALASARLVKQPLVIVVINNAGGRIFEMLPLASQCSAEELEPWTTPHQARLEGASELFGVRYARARQRGQIGPALSQALSTPELTLLEVQVGPSTSLTAQRALWSEATTRISALELADPTVEP